MNDQELLNAIQAMVRSEIEPIKTELSGVKVLLDTDIRQKLNVLYEGHEAIMQRLPEPEDLNALDSRITVVETVVREHSKDIVALKKAQ